LRFELTKRKTGLSFFEKTLFGLQMLNQTGTKHHSQSCGVVERHRCMKKGV